MKLSRSAALPAKITGVRRTPVLGACGFKALMKCRATEHAAKKLMFKTPVFIKQQVAANMWWEPQPPMHSSGTLSFHSEAIINSSRNGSGLMSSARSLGKQKVHCSSRQLGGHTWQVKRVLRRAFEPSPFYDIRHTRWRSVGGHHHCERSLPIVVKAFSVWLLCVKWPDVLEGHWQTFRIIYLNKMIGLTMRSVNVKPISY